MKILRHRNSREDGPLIIIATVHQIKLQSYSGNGSPTKCRRETIGKQTRGACNERTRGDEQEILRETRRPRDDRAGKFAEELLLGAEKYTIIKHTRQQLLQGQAGERERRAGEICLLSLSEIKRNAVSLIRLAEIRSSRASALNHTFGNTASLQGWATET